MRTNPVTAQICKSLVLITSSLGLGWALGKLWESSISQIDSESPMGIQQEHPMMRGGILGATSTHTAVAIFRQCVLPSSATQMISQQKIQ